MSQIVKIECSNCEGIETYELEGCMLVGVDRDGKLFVKAHDLTWGDVVDTFMVRFMEEKQ